MIKTNLIFPHVDLDIKRYDLGIESRDKTDDKSKHFFCHSSMCGRTNTPPHTPRRVFDVLPL